MRGPIEARIAALRGQVRRLLALHGLSWLIFGLVTAVLLACSADWVLNLVPEVRLTMLVAIGLLAAYLAIRGIVLPLVVKFADLDIALRIEDRWPGLNDRLASTVQFLRSAEGDDSGRGSKALRDATVAQTLEQVESIDFRQAADPRAARKAVAWAVVALAAFGTIATLEPVLGQIAVARLFRPYGPDRWPQMTHLTVLDETPRKIARGMPFTLAVAVGKNERMPATAKVTYRYPDGETSTEPLRPTDDGTFRGRIDAAVKPFSFRVTAGDDVTASIDVAVVPPPVFEKTTVRLVAPAYTGLKPVPLAPGNTQVRAVEGTRIEFEGKANKPIASAVLRRGDVVAKEKVAIDASGLGLSTAFVVKDSQPFWIELKDTEGFASQEVARFDIRALKDEAPRVVIDDPSHDRDVPPDATVPIQVTVDDDFGVQLVRLVYKVATSGSEPAQESIIPLWAPPEPAEGAEMTQVRHREVGYRWDLSTLKNLEPGAIISFYAEGRDFDNLKGPNIGKSREMRFRIVSKEDVDRQMEDQQRAIREEIDRILAIQKQAKSPVDDALRVFKQTETLPEAVKNNVKNAEIIQRQVNNRITNKSDGLEQKLRQVQQDAADFKVDNPDAARQIAEMREAVQKIKDRNLGPAEQNLTLATKQLDQAGADQPPGGEPPKDQQQPGQPEAPKPGQPAGDPGKAQSKDQAQPGNDAQAQPKGQPGAEAEKAQPKQAGESGKAQPKKAGEPSKDNKPGASPKAALAESEKNQKAIVDELEKMQASMGRFDDIRTAAKEATSLLKQQEQAMKQAAEAASKPDAAGKDQKDLTPEQKGENANLAAKQAEIAKALGDLQAKMEEMAKKLDATDPLGASALREASQESRKKGTTSKMGEAAEQLDKNQMGQAQSNQAQAKRDLKDLVDAIQNRRERELSRLVAELKNAEADLKKLREKQAANLKKTQQAKANPDAAKKAEELKKLAKEQQQIQEDLKKQIQKLAKLNAEAGAQAGAKAAEAMSKAQAKLDQGDNEGAEEAEQAEDEAMKDLKQAQEEVAQVRKDAEEQLAMEQMAKMADGIKSIAERQNKMIAETTGYEKTKTDNGGKLTRGEKDSVRELGRAQDGLKDEATELIDRLGDGAPVFKLTLERAIKSMDDSARRLKDLKTDEVTVRSEKLAAGRFQQLIDSLKPDKGKPGGQQQQQGGDQGGGQQGSGGGDGIPASAQIKVLKSLQQELNERTDFFDELLRRQKELNPEQTTELDKLHEDQGLLADLVRDLTKPKKEDGED